MEKIFDEIEILMSQLNHKLIMVLMFRLGERDSIREILLDEEQELFIKQ